MSLATIRGKWLEFLASHVNIFSFVAFGIWIIFALWVIIPKVRRRRFLRLIVGVISVYLMWRVFEKQSSVVNEHLFEWILVLFGVKNNISPKVMVVVRILFNVLFYSFPIWIVYLLNLITRGVFGLIESFFEKVVREVAEFKAIKDTEYKHEIIEEISDMEASYKLCILPLLYALKGVDDGSSEYSVFLKGVQNHYDLLGNKQEKLNRISDHYNMGIKLSLPIFDE